VKDLKTYNSSAPIAGDRTTYLTARLPEKKREELRRQREQGMRGKRPGPSV
jgi:hypothetical protein